MSQPSIGQMVHYVGEFGVCWAAICTAPANTEQQTCLTVSPPQRLSGFTTASHDEGKTRATWHWACIDRDDQSFRGTE